MSIVSEALMFATYHHQHQNRKGTKIPYMAHLLNVCKILAEKNCEDEILAAALLHDVVEDTDVTIEEVEEKFGVRIANIVRGCTEQDKLEKKAFDKKASWRERKEHTMHFLQTAATQDQLLVSAADKLDNLRAIAYDYQRIGEIIWKRFNAPKEEQHWYYVWLQEAFMQRADNNSLLHELANEMKDLCSNLFDVQE
jgi:(p)ppGpp synthase/HD superfamily hydrolase